MKILIVGAGISGLTLACFLKKNKKFQVEIIDKSKNWNHLGYTLGIWEMGRRMLAKMDLQKEFDKQSHRIHSLYITDKDSKHLLRAYHFEEFYKKYGSAYAHISRKNLHNMILKKSNCIVKMNTSIETLTQKDDLVEVVFSDGRIKSYDLVVGADGLKSKVRNLIFPNQKAEYTGNRVWFAWTERKFVANQSIAEIIEKNKICDLFDDPTNACLVLTAPEVPSSFDDPNTRIERLKNHFKNFGEPLPEILSSLKAEDLMPTDIGFVNSSEWVKNRVVIIGDAAHAMEPFAGVGASMGMEDAYVLADELIRTSGGKLLSKALEDYSKRRLPRINLARRQTRLQYWWISSKIPGLALLRKLVLPIVPIKHFTKGYAQLLSEEV